LVLVRQKIFAKIVQKAVKGLAVSSDVKSYLTPTKKEADDVSGTPQYGTKIGR